ncbi:MAG: helix-turn-helix transcriptional regulator [Bacteroidales bacterium]|nr:helix-turn-helix transcriptional regulator [Bacteroidales bacterium]
MLSKRIMELNNILQISFAITGIVNCLIAAGFLYSIGNFNSASNRVFAILLSAIAFKISFALLINFPHQQTIFTFIIYFFSEAAYLSFGPLIFLYFRILLKRKPKFPTLLFIFLPSVSPFIGYFFQYDIPLWFMQTHFFPFLAIVFFDLKKNLKNTKNIDKQWIKIVFVCFVIIWSSVNLLFINFNLYFLELLVILLITFYIGVFHAFKFYGFKSGDRLKTAKYANSKLSEEEEAGIMQQLIHLMESEKLYMDSGITLPKVSQNLKIRPHKLSQVINQRMNMTFNEYINSYRIKEIKKAISKPEFQDTKIASLAFDYGFNSLSSFHSAFKKFTSYTPAQYRNEVVLKN